MTRNALTLTKNDCLPDYYTVLICVNHEMYMVA